MTVSDLIKQLKSYPQDAEVFTYVPNCDIDVLHHADPICCNILSAYKHYKSNETIKTNNKNDIFIIL
jgi:hypothetical protein